VLVEMEILNQIFELKADWIADKICDPKFDDFMTDYINQIEKDKRTPLFSMTERFMSFNDKPDFKRGAMYNEFRECVWKPTDDKPKTFEEIAKEQIIQAFNKMTEINYRNIIKYVMYNLENIRNKQIVVDIFIQELIKKIRFDTIYHSIYFEWTKEMEKVYDSELINKIINKLVQIIETRSEIVEKVKELDGNMDAQYKKERVFISAIEFLVIMAINNRIKLSWLWDTWKGPYTKIDIEAFYIAWKLINLPIKKDIINNFRENLDELTPRLDFYLTEIENCKKLELSEMWQQLIQKKISGIILCNWMRQMEISDEELINNLMVLIYTTFENNAELDKYMIPEDIKYLFNSLCSDGILYRRHIDIIMKNIVNDYEENLEDYGDDSTKIYASLTDFVLELSKIIRYNICNKSFADYAYDKIGFKNWNSFRKLFDSIPKTYGAKTVFAQNKEKKIPKVNSFLILNDDDDDESE
jgi:hypothetical protein